jgi:hypothetical protein
LFFFAREEGEEREGERKRVNLKAGKNKKAAQRSFSDSP